MVFDLPGNAGLGQCSEVLIFIVCGNIYFILYAILYGDINFLPLNAFPNLSITYVEWKI
jgi:hypothetical protein